MLVKILKPARVHHAPGEVVDIHDPRELNFLLSTGSVEVLRAATPEAPEGAIETRTVKKATRKKTK